MRLKSIVKDLLFPGVNLHARLRYRVLPRYFDDHGVPRRVLDVGCGNGMLSYAAWRRGAVVKGTSIHEHEIVGCRRYFNARKGIPTTELSFERARLQDLVGRPAAYDAVICAEVLEHIRDDRDASRTLWGLLVPGGCLHVTVPNAAHPYNASFPLDGCELGGHVRPGYTLDGLRALFEPLGFLLEEFEGLGGPIRQAFNRRIKETQEKLGIAAGVPLFFMAIPWLPLDSKHPVVPFCLYVKFRKPKGHEGLPDA